MQFLAVHYNVYNTHYVCILTKTERIKSYILLSDNVLVLSNLSEIYSSGAFRMNRLYINSNIHTFTESSGPMKPLFTSTSCCPKFTVYALSVRVTFQRSIFTPITWSRRDFFKTEIPSISCSYVLQHSESCPPINNIIKIVLKSFIQLYKPS